MACSSLARVRIIDLRRRSRIHTTRFPSLIARRRTQARPVRDQLQSPASRSNSASALQALSIGLRPLCGIVATEKVFDTVSRLAGLRPRRGAGPCSPRNWKAAGRVGFRRGRRKLRMLARILPGNDSGSAQKALSPGSGPYYNYRVGIRRSAHVDPFGTLLSPASIAFLPAGPHASAPI